MDKSTLHQSDTNQPVLTKHVRLAREQPPRTKGLYTRMHTPVSSEIQYVLCMFCFALIAQ